MSDLAMADIRPGEITLTLPGAFDAGVYFIGRIHTPWTARADCPKSGDLDGPECEIALMPRFEAALKGIEAFTHLQILYFMHQARRDLAFQIPRHGKGAGTFALRSPVRPNPIASSVARLVRRTGARLIVRGLDCLDGTPLIDIKPGHGTQSRGASPEAGGTRA